MVSAETLRQALGRAHYERMRVAMRPDLDLPAWEDTSPAHRETYCKQMEYALPDVLAAVIDHPEDPGWPTPSP